jgi:hypothetical protein
MIKCANCPNEAVFTIAERAVSPVSYCPRCLPVQFRDGASSGQFPLLTDPVPSKPQVIPGNIVEVPVKKTAKKKKATTAKPELVTEPIPQEELEAAIADGYKADATDGDADGLVQDTTPFERPEGEILVDYSEESTEEV